VEKKGLEREKTLVKNTGILAIGRLSSKLFTFLLLPLYTAVLLPEDYGLVDVLQTVLGLVLYFVTLQIESAIFRFLLDDRKNMEQISGYVSTGLLVVLGNLLLATAIILLVHVFYPFNHVVLFILCLWAESISLVFRNIARGLGHTGLYSISSFAITVTSLLVNLILILGFHLGASSILVALVLSNLVGSLLIGVKEKLWKQVNFREVSLEKLKKMLHYSIPLIPSALSWWIANVSDRLLIAAFLGSAMNGIYAAANKIPTIYTTIFTVYNLAWIESVSMAVKDKDIKEYIRSMMDKSFRLLTFLALGIICCVSLFFPFLFGQNYEAAYNHVYILMVAIFFNSLCSLYGGIFTGFMDSKAIGVTTILGAVVNFLFNLAFIRVIGLYAASLSTLISYIVIFLVRKQVAKKRVDIRWSKSFSLQAIVALALITLGYFSKNYLLNGILLVLLILWGVVNNWELVKGAFSLARGKWSQFLKNRKKE
jgi:O-antigen/teichoic acid export membrane protein